MERKFGLTTIFSTIEYPPAFDKCDILWPNRRDFELAFKISMKLRKIGKPIGAIDIIIASMCINRDLELWTKDKDFKSIKLVDPRFKLRVKK